MNKTQIDNFRKIMNTPSKQDNYCIRDHNGLMIMAWITKERAEQYQTYYKNAIVEKMNK
ncbi:MAG: hypothetical protein M0R03_08610 [Novosphingobium sp.]|nr:hypothetical protein [Novosphingobium sp.]